MTLRELEQKLKALPIEAQDMDVVFLYNDGRHNNGHLIETVEVVRDMTTRGYYPADDYAHKNQHGKAIIVELA